MAKYKIFTDSTTDLLASEFAQMELGMISHGFTADDVTIFDNCDRTSYDLPEFYRRMREDKLMPSTNMPNLDTFLSQFPPFLEAGQDILFLCFSSGLSGTFQTASIAINELSAQYPQRRILLIDTHSAAYGQGMLVKMVVQKRDEGATLEEAAAFAEMWRDRILHYFVVNDLGYLQRGGRLSKASAVVGTILGMKPVLHCNKEGKLLPIDKVRGRKSSLDVIVGHIVNEAADPGNHDVYISHGDCKEDALYVKEQIEQKLKPRGVVVGTLNPVIATHTGPGVLAIFAVGQERAL